MSKAISLLKNKDPWFIRPWKAIVADRWFLLMCLPGIVWLLLFSYLPMPGIVMAFQRIAIGGKNFLDNLLHPVAWIGMRNFNAYFGSPDFLRTTLNTLAYNIVFMALGLAGSVFVAIAASEIWNKTAVRFYQTVMILPAFLSWVIVSYLIYSFLNPEFGVVNNFLVQNGFEAVRWYNEKKVWYVLLPLFNLWKGVGLGSIYYFAAISGLDVEMYEAAQVEGASRFQQIMKITLPLLKPTMVVLTILGLGSIIRSDFGLFYVATLQMGRGALYETVSTIDTYTYSLLMSSGRISLGASVGLYQSVVGLFMIIGVNLIVRRIDKDSAIF
jgi:putative aldouronate transport system permease protein